MLTLTPPLPHRPVSSALLPHPPAAHLPPSSWPSPRSSPSLAVAAPGCRGGRRIRAAGAALTLPHQRSIRGGERWGHYTSSSSPSSPWPATASGGARAPRRGGGGPSSRGRPSLSPRRRPPFPCLPPSRLVRDPARWGGIRWLRAWIRPSPLQLPRPLRPGVWIRAGGLGGLIRRCEQTWWLDLASEAAALPRPQIRRRGGQVLQRHRFAGRRLSSGIDSPAVSSLTNHGKSPHHSLSLSLPPSLPLTVLVHRSTGNGGWWRRRVRSIDDGEKEQRRARHDGIRRWQTWWCGCDFLFLGFSEMFVVRRRRRTTNKINIISMFCNFFAVCHLDPRQRPFTVKKSVVRPLPCVFLTFVMRSKRTAKSSFRVVT
jgi:hypothetical protein